MQGITVLGSTGSIGTNALAVIARHPRRYRVVALSAYTRADALLQQCLTFAPEYAVLSDPDEAERMEQQLRAQGSACQVLCGREGLVRIAALQQAAVVIAGIVGAAGLEPTLAAVTAGKRVLLANKEALVMAGEIFMAAVRSHSATLLPLDSEHSAIHQALPRGFNGNLHAAGVRRIVLTASGGPFRLLDSKDLESVTIEQACAHPNWVMGPKISVDSATMMNKGLEVIEAHWLFGADADRIGVVVHPQSIVHSMVEYRDGSTLAQLGQPDMCTPIAYALAYPERIDAGVEAVDLTRVGRLDFHAPDPERFPCLRLAAAALHAGGITPAVLNAANEVAVERFLAGDIRFPSIARLTEDVLGRIANQPARTLDAVLAADANARECARAWMPSANSRTPRVSAFSTTSAG